MLIQISFRKKLALWLGGQENSLLVSFRESLFLSQLHSSTGSFYFFFRFFRATIVFPHEKTCKSSQTLLQQKAAPNNLSNSTGLGEEPYFCQAAEDERSSGLQPAPTNSLWLYDSFQRPAKPWTDWPVLHVEIWTKDVHPDPDKSFSARTQRRWRKPLPCSSGAHI